jgi:hypothetical protein
MRLPLLVVVCLVASSAPGLAQPGKVTVGVGSGIAAAMTQELNSVTDSDLSISSHVTVELSRGLALRGEIGRHEFNTATPAFDFCNDLGHRCEGDLRFTNVTGGIQYGGLGGRSAALDTTAVCAGPTPSRAKGSQTGPASFSASSTAGATV